MAVERGLLLIADIAGYTRFMDFHRADLAHAQDVVARLLEAMIDASPSLQLVEVEGDAAFLYRPSGDAASPELAETALRQSVSMHRAFHTVQQKIACLNGCPCQGCSQAGNLRVKFVAHLGEVAPQRVKQLTRLAGFDVIVVHRMLKNSVPVREYLLMTEPLWERADARVRAGAQSLEQEFEGVGRTRTYYLDLTTLAEPLPPPPQATWLARQVETFGTVLRALPVALGLRKPVVLRNLTPA